MWKVYLFFLTTCDLITQFNHFLFFISLRVSVRKWQVELNSNRQTKLYFSHTWGRNHPWQASREELSAVHGICAVEWCACMWRIPHQPQLRAHRCPLWHAVSLSCCVFLNNHDCVGFVVTITPDICFFLEYAVALAWSSALKTSTQTPTTWWDTKCKAGTCTRHTWSNLFMGLTSCCWRYRLIHWIIFTIHKAYYINYNRSFNN